MTLFWTLIVALAIGMTAYQMTKMAENLSGETTQTKLSLLSAETPPQYPHYLIQCNYFTDWLDLEKIEEYKIDYETLMYTMSYFHPVYITSPTFDINLARQKLQIIMNRHFYDSLYDFALDLALDKPANILSNEIVVPFFDPQGQLYYKAAMDDTILKSADFLETSQHKIVARSYSSLEETPFNEDFQKIFNNSFLNQYKWFKRYFFGDNAAHKNLESTLYFLINPVAEKSMFNQIDIFKNNYEFFLHGTLYQWKPTVDNNCTEDQAAKFYSQCLHECSVKNKLSELKMCQLFYVSEEIDIEEYNTVINPVNLCSEEDDRLTHEENEGSEKPSESFDNCISECRSGCVQWKFESTEAVHINQASIALNKRVTGSVVLTYNKKDEMLVIAIVPLYKWYEALASLGGLLGLWLGGSILAFVQLVYVFCCTPCEDAALDRQQKLENEKRHRRMKRLAEKHGTMEADNGVEGSKTVIEKIGGMLPHDSSKKYVPLSAKSIGVTIVEPKEQPSLNGEHTFHGSTENADLQRIQRDMEKYRKHLAKVEKEINVLKSIWLEYENLND